MPRARSPKNNNASAYRGFASPWLLYADPRAAFVPANAPFNDSDTGPRGSALLQDRTNPQVMREAQDNFPQRRRRALIALLFPDSYDKS